MNYNAHIPDTETSCLCFAHDNHILVSRGGNLFSLSPPPPSLSLIIFVINCMYFSQIIYHLFYYFHQVILLWRYGIFVSSGTQSVLSLVSSIITQCKPGMHIMILRYSCNYCGYTGVSYCFIYRTDCSFNPDETIIITGTSAQKQKVRIYK